MSSNILTAIQNIINSSTAELHSFYTSHNRANNMGESLENYIKDAFAGTLLETNEQIRLEKLSQVFSYLGNQNNPPDMILRGGDAIEVKKIESEQSQLALNSSYPKAKLFADSPMITTACRDCEAWTEKDIIYAVGVTANNRLSKLFFVYGVDYAASSEIYERIKSAISAGVSTISGIEFSPTRELGRVNRVDPLGITYMRIRGMWVIENPLKEFSYVLPHVPKCDFQCTAIINNDKYNSFPEEDRTFLEYMALRQLYTSDNHSLTISDVKIKSPDNPSIPRDAKVINFIRRTEK